MAYKFFWRVTWALLAAWTPPPLHPWRRLLLRLFGARIAPGARVYGSARISDPRNLEMGRQSVIGFHTHVYCDGPVVLEDYANVAQHNLIETMGWSFDSAEATPVIRGVRFCRYCWVASYCYVGPGVVLGEGAVLGAGAVALGSVAPWMIAVGNPADPKRSRRNWLADGQGGDR